MYSMNILLYLLVVTSLFYSILGVIGQDTNIIQYGRSEVLNTSIHELYIKKYFSIKLFNDIIMQFLNLK